MIFFAFMPQDYTYLSEFFASIFRNEIHLSRPYDKPCSYRSHQILNLNLDRHNVSHFIFEVQSMCHKRQMWRNYSHNSNVESICRKMSITDVLSFEDKIHEQKYLVLIICKQVKKRTYLFLLQILRMT